MPNWPRLLMLALVAVVSAPVLASQCLPGKVPCGEIPLAVEGNVPIVTLEFTRPDGTRRKARFLFDSGGGAVILNRSLADDLSLKADGAPVTDDDNTQYFPTRMPQAWLGAMPLDIGSVQAFTPAANNFDPRDSVEGLLPSRVFEHYDVLIDYPLHRFAVGLPGSISHQGRAEKSPFLPEHGHPRIEVEIDGVNYGMLLDTGSKMTLVRRDLIESWTTRHPHWPHSSGAVGPANMTGTDDEKNALLLRIPELSWTGVSVNNAVVVSRDNQIYTASSQEMTAPIVGALGGNVLSSFRVEIDYPEQTTYAQSAGQPARNDMDTVGLVLIVNSSGELVIKSISPQASSLTRGHLHPGDVIESVGGTRGRRPQTLTEAAQDLSGKPGETKRMVVRRNGEELQTTATVSHIL